MKSRIELFYRKLLSGDRNLGMHLQTVDKIAPSSGQAFLTAGQAFDVYAAKRVTFRSA